MREIRLSGSGEGAVLSRPYLISATAVGATAEYLRLIVDGPSRANRAFRARTVPGGDAEHYTRGRVCSPNARLSARFSETFREML